MRSALLLSAALALAAPAPAGEPAAPAAPLGPVPPAELKPNTWTPVKIDAPLPADIKGARWETTDGFSYSVYRAKTGTVLARTGIDCKSAGYCPGDDTYVLEPGKTTWTNLKCGDVKLGSWRYLQYDPKTDITAMSTHLNAFKFRYVPEKQQERTR